VLVAEVLALIVEVELLELIILVVVVAVELKEVVQAQVVDQVVLELSLSDI